MILEIIAFYTSITIEGYKVDSEKAPKPFSIINYKPWESATQEYNNHKWIPINILWVAKHIFQEWANNISSSSWQAWTHLRPIEPRQKDERIVIESWVTEEQMFIRLQKAAGIELPHHEKLSPDWHLPNIHFPGMRING